uniref:MHC class I-like antigen recognition-like domain-containing protein n=1 Tax=Pseudonaja textilis TaxID=8673 RepID=A0A670Z315_PSETE
AWALGKVLAIQLPPYQQTLPSLERCPPSHSLSYFYLKLPESSQGLPQFFIKVHLDDQPIIRFESLTRKMEPLVPWMEEAGKKFLVPEWIFRADLETLSKLDQEAGGEQSQGHQCLLERKEAPPPPPILSPTQKFFMA